MQSIQNLKRFLALLLILIVPAVLTVAYFRNYSPNARHEHGGGDEGGMEHGAMPSMKAGAPAEPMSHEKMGGMQGGEQGMQHSAAPQPGAPDQAQIEASRMQLEASRLQLEASRKQLETAVPKQSEPGAAPAEQPPMVEHAEKKQPAAEPNTSGMNSMLGHLNQPEYMHVLLNPMPVYGLSMGIVAMIVALISRRRPVIVAALILILLAGLSAWPTYHYGQAAYDRVKSMSDTVGSQWLDGHMARAEKLIYSFYVLAAVAAAGIFAPLKWPRSSTPLAIIAAGLGMATLGIGGWISYAGGHVRHKEFRFEPPPTAKMKEHTHGAGEGAMDHGKMPGKPAESEQAKPMDHGSMPGMESSKSDNSKEQPMQPDAAEQPAAPTQEQLEASRLQLEASRLQLEASRKQLEATGEKPQTSGTQPQAGGAMQSPTPQQTAPKPAEDGHDHQH